VTPPLSPQRTIRLTPIPERRRLSTHTHQHPHRSIPMDYFLDAANASSSYVDPDATPRSSTTRLAENTSRSENRDLESASPSHPPRPSSMLSYNESQRQPSILEQAWVMKMAGEIARQMQENKASSSTEHKSYWTERGHDEMPPPPAYGQ